MQYHLSVTCKNNKLRNRKKLQRRYKLELVATFGGCCQKCGYAKCLAALQFHHKDANSKTATVTRYASKDRMLTEALKCELLCANCHAEVTHPE